MKNRTWNYRRNVELVNKVKSDFFNYFNYRPIRDICAVTLARFTGKKGANISPQIIFLDDSIARHLAILGAEYRKNSSEPVFRQ